jgi:hypothetical protein
VAQHNQTAEATRSEARSRTIRTAKGSRVVVINEQDGVYSSRLWVNCSATDLGDATLVARKHTSEAGARRWAAKVLAS